MSNSFLNRLRFKKFTVSCNINYTWSQHAAFDYYIREESIVGTWKPKTPHVAFSPRALQCGGDRLKKESGYVVQPAPVVTPPDDGSPPPDNQPPVLVKGDAYAGFAVRQIPAPVYQVQPDYPFPKFGAGEEVLLKYDAGQINFVPFYPISTAVPILDKLINSGSMWFPGTFPPSQKPDEYIFESPDAFVAWLNLLLTNTAPPIFFPGAPNDITPNPLPENTERASTFFDAKEDFDAWLGDLWSRKVDLSGNQFVWANGELVNDDQNPPLTIHSKEFFDPGVTWVDGLENEIHPESHDDTIQSAALPFELIGVSEGTEKIEKLNEVEIRIDKYGAPISTIVQGPPYTEFYKAPFGAPYFGTIRKTLKELRFEKAGFPVRWFLRPVTSVVDIRFEPTGTDFEKQYGLPARLTQSATGFSFAVNKSGMWRDYNNANWSVNVAYNVTWENS